MMLTTVPVRPWPPLGGGRKGGGGGGLTVARIGNGSLTTTPLPPKAAENSRLCAPWRELFCSRSRAPRRQQPPPTSLHRNAPAVNVHCFAAREARYEVVRKLQHARLAGDAAVDDREVHELEPGGLAAREGGIGQRVDERDGVENVGAQLVAAAPLKLAHALVLVPAGEESGALGVGGEAAARAAAGAASRTTTVAGERGAAKQRARRSARPRHHALLLQAHKGPNAEAQDPRQDGGVGLVRHLQGRGARAAG